MPKLKPTDWEIQAKIFETSVAPSCAGLSHLVYDHPEAKRPVIIPKYGEVPVTVIRTNMRTVSMSRDQYFKLLQEVL